MHIDDTISALVAKAVRAEDNFSLEYSVDAFVRATEAIEPWVKRELEVRDLKLNDNESDVLAVAAIAVQAAMIQHRFVAREAAQAMAALGPCEDETGFAPFPGAPLKSPPGWPVA